MTKQSTPRAAAPAILPDRTRSGTRRTIRSDEEDDDDSDTSDLIPRHHKKLKPESVSQPHDHSTFATLPQVQTLISDSLLVLRGQMQEDLQALLQDVRQQPSHSSSSSMAAPPSLPVSSDPLPRPTVAEHLPAERGPIAPPPSGNAREYISALHVHALIASNNETSSLVPLTPLAPAITDTPSRALGLLLGHDSLLFRVTSTAPPLSLDMNFSDLFACVALPPDGILRHMPAGSSVETLPVDRPDFPVTIRSHFALGQEHLFYDFVNMRTQAVIHHILIPLRTQSSAVSHGLEFDTELKSTSKTSRIGPAALSHMSLPASRLSDKTGTDVLHGMLYDTSAIETQLNLPDHLTARPVAVDQSTALNLSRFIVRDISDWAPATVTAHELAATLRKAQPRVTLLIASDALTAWYNVVVALSRTFEFKVDSLITQSLWDIHPRMTQFLTVHSPSHPSMATNGFVSLYLNFLIHDFCKVLGNYHSTSSMLDSMLADFRVGDDTKHFRRTKTAMKLQAEARLESLYSTRSNPGPRRPDPVTTPSVIKPSRLSKLPPPPPATVASVTPKKVPYPCMKFMTKQGCSFQRCTYPHLTSKPTADQVKNIRLSFQKWKDRFPDRPLDLDDDRL